MALAAGHELPAVHFLALHVISPVEQPTPNAVEQLRHFLRPDLF
jgi:hypothetical protein